MTTSAVVIEACRCLQTERKEEEDHDHGADAEDTPGGPSQEFHDFVQRKKGRQEPDVEPKTLEISKHPLKRKARLNNVASDTENSESQDQVLSSEAEETMKKRGKPARTRALPPKAQALPVPPKRKARLNNVASDTESSESQDQVVSSEAKATMKKRGKSARTRALPPKAQALPVPPQRTTRRRQKQRSETSPSAEERSLSQEESSGTEAEETESTDDDVPLHLACK